VISAAIREAKEESGVTIYPEQISVVGIIHRKNTTSEWVDFFLKAESWENEILNAEPEKCEELKWFKRNALPDNMIPYIRKAVEKEHDNIWFSSVGWE